MEAFDNLGVTELDVGLKFDSCRKMSWRFSETIVHAMRAGILVLFIDVFQVSGMVPGT